QLDTEIGALPAVAARGGDVATAMLQMFGAPACRPSALLLRRRFSAALEFLECSCRKVNAGANPRKNDPGIYFDFQLLFYLGSDGLSFLTDENFGHEIRNSPQR